MLLSQTIPELRPLVQLAGSGGWRLKLPHERDHHLLLWVTRAKGTLLLDGLRRGLTANTAIYVPAGTLLALDAGPGLFGSALIVPVEAGVRLPDAPHRLSVASVQAQADLAALIEAMAREDRNAETRAGRDFHGDLHGDFHGEAARAHAGLIAIWLRRMLLTHDPAPKLRADQKLAQGFSRLMLRHYRSGRRLPDYAAELGVTAGHLTRACKRATGQGAGDLLTGRLLHAARLLLVESDHPVGRIAAHLGFQSAAGFTRFVQNHTGQTPTGLRTAAAARRMTQP